MKTFSRRYRRSRLTSREQAMFKKNNQHEQTFFSGSSNDSFFKPVMRKCDHCVAEEKTVQKMSDSKEDENKVQKQEEKKEEKPITKMDEKQEPDKSVSKQDEKKEEKPMMKMDEKKEEKPVMKMDEKQEPDKSVSKQDEKNEEKPVMKLEEKKEEKPVMKMDEKKEPDKSLSKQDEKKEEKPVMKMEEKKEEKPVMKMEEKKEEKPVLKMDEKKEEKLSKKEAASNASSTSSIGSYLKSLNGKGNTLPTETQQFFKQRMGHDFGNVRIHTGSEAEQSAKDLSAKAYAVDQHIVFNKGQYNPNTPEGKKLLAHELTHVAQQKGNGMNVLSRATDNAEIRKKESSNSVTSSGKGTNPNQTGFACKGLSVEGKTEANYTDSFTSSGSVKPSTKCADCPDDCVSTSGTIVSEFKANPTVTLPAVPGGLSECETNTVEKFINTTLAKHEQKHVDAFNTYNGTIKTPYRYNGCHAALDAHLQSVHSAINAKRTAAANKKSAKLDPFNPTIPCKCDD